MLYFPQPNRDGYVDETEINNVKLNPPSPGWKLVLRRNHDYPMIKGTKASKNCRRIRKTLVDIGGK